MTDLSALLPFIIAVIVLFIVAGSVIGLVRGRRTKTRYPGTTCAMDPACFRDFGVVGSCRIRDYNI